MFELSHLAAAYVVGSAAAVWLFRTWVKESIITATIDTLARDGYLYSQVDRNGVMHLTKWYEIEEREEEMWDEMESDLDVIDRLTPEEVTAILEKLIEEETKREEDDTP